MNSAPRQPTLRQPTLRSPTLRSPTLRDYFGVSIYWLGLSFFWGAMLTLVLPDRIGELFPDDKDRVLTLVISAGAAVATVAQVFFGAWSDTSRHPKGRRRPFLLVGTLGACLTLLFFPGARTLVALLAVFLLIQFWVNMASGPYQGLMPDRIPAHKHGAAASWMGAASLIGRIGGPIAASILLRPEIQNWLAPRAAWLSVLDDNRGLSLLTLIFIVVLAVAMVATLFTVRETPLDADTPKVGIGATLSGIIKVPLRPYPSFVWLMISRLGIMLGVYTVSFCLLYYIRDTLGFKGEGESLGVLTKFLLISTVAGVIGTIPAGILSDRLGKKPILYFANSVCMASGLAFALSSNLTMAYGAAAIFGIGFGAFSAVDWALACNLLPPDAPAKYLGLWGISDTLSQVVAPLLAGPLAFWLNGSLGGGAGYRALMLLALVYFALGTLAIRWIREKRVAHDE